MKLSFCTSELLTLPPLIFMNLILLKCNCVKKIWRRQWNLIRERFSFFGIRAIRREPHGRSRWRGRARRQENPFTASGHLPLTRTYCGLGGGPAAMQTRPLKRIGIPFRDQLEASELIFMTLWQWLEKNRRQNGDSILSSSRLPSTTRILDRRKKNQKEIRGKKWSNVECVFFFVFPSHMSEFLKAEFIQWKFLAQQNSWSLVLKFSWHEMPNISYVKWI